MSGVPSHNLKTGMDVEGFVTVRLGQGSKCFWGVRN